MVLGILTAIAACPAIIGTTEAVRQGQRKSAKEQHRGVKNNLIVSCYRPTKLGSEINGGSVVLRNNKLYILGPGAEAEEEKPSSYKFLGYFLPFPDQNWGRKGEGLVSRISDDPPQLNWVYVDQETYEIKYGIRVEAEPNLVGPWDCTRIDKRLTLEGWEGFMAVRDEPGVWSLYFDRDDNGLKDKVVDKTILEIDLTRKEGRTVKEYDDE